MKGLRCSEHWCAPLRLHLYETFKASAWSTGTHSPRWAGQGGVIVKSKVRISDCRKLQLLSQKAEGRYKFTQAQQGITFIRITC